MKTVTPDKRYTSNLKKVELIRVMANNDILDPDIWKCILYYPGRSCKTVSATATLDYDDWAFINGATLLPAVSLTLNGSVGAVFRKPTDIKLSSGLEYMRTNADGSGKTLEQVFQEAVSENVSIGYGGFFTDFAESVEGDENLTIAQAEAAGKVATISVYRFESIPIVLTKKIGNIDKVWSIVLCETSEEIVDEFTTKVVKQYRVLTYDESGNYIQKVYTENEGGTVDDKDFKLIKPTANGAPLKDIPFRFFGAQSNDHKVDAAPLYPMSTLNARHVELSAIRNDSVRKLRPTLFGKTGDNFDSTVWTTAYPEGLVLSSGKSYWGFEGAEIVQPTPNDSASTDMERVKTDILNSGSLLITPQVSGLSTETVEINKSTETSVLGVVVRNVESAGNLALDDAQGFMGGSGENKATLNRDFINIPLTPEDIKTMGEQVMQDLISYEEYRVKLEKHGVIADAEAHVRKAISVNNDNKDGNGGE